MILTGIKALVLYLLFIYTSIIPTYISSKNLCHKLFILAKTKENFFFKNEYRNEVMFLGVVEMIWYGPHTNETPQIIDFKIS